MPCLVFGCNASGTKAYMVNFDVVFFLDVGSYF